MKINDNIASLLKCIIDCYYMRHTLHAFNFARLGRGWTHDDGPHRIQPFKTESQSEGDGAARN